MDKKRLEQIQNILDLSVKNGEIAGANVLIYQNGEEQYYCDSGYADIEKNIPIKRDTIFRLYSMTKPVTGAAAMALVEKGMLDLGEPVYNYIPAFKHIKVWENGSYRAPKREMLVKDLLGMTSGLIYGDKNGNPVQKAVDELFESGQLTTMEFAENLAGIGLAFDPGEKYCYGSSADVIGAVIEAASGMKYSEFLSKEFFLPLQMDDTGFFIDERKKDRLANVYQHKNGTLIPYTDDHLYVRNYPTNPPAFESGGAGLLSTADDYMKFAAMLLNGGMSSDGKQILSKKTIGFFASSQLTPKQHEYFSDWYGLLGYGYGNFMRVMQNPGQAVMMGSAGEYGWDGWLGTYFLNSPNDKLTFILNTQKTDCGTAVVTRKCRNICMASL